MGSICRAATFRARAIGGASICELWWTGPRFSQVPLLERRHFCVKSSLEPPDVAQLAKTARISLTHQGVEEFAPKIQQVVEWFGQLQGVDLESIEPAIRAETEGDSVREDLPEVFENCQAIVDGIPSYKEPYIKVPKVLNKE